LRFKLKEVRVAHFETPSPKYFAPISPISLLLRKSFNEVRIQHFEIPFPKYCVPLSPILF